MSHNLKTSQEIFDILFQNFAHIQSEYGVKKMGVFGSVIRNNHTSASDVDILVEFSQSIGMVKFLQLENRLKDLLGFKVDLVTRNALKKHIGQQILREVQYVK